MADLFSGMGVSRVGTTSVCSSASELPSNEFLGGSYGRPSFQKKTKKAPKTRSPVAPAIQKRGRFSDPHAERSNRGFFTALSRWLAIASLPHVTSVADR